MPDDPVPERLTARALTDSVRRWVEQRLDAFEASTDEQLDDVRDRVVQVKLEVDEKAPADHGHPDLERRTERLASLLDALEGDLEDAVEAFDDGVENETERIARLAETTDELDEKLTLVANTVVDMREQLAELDETTSRRTTVDQLALTANRYGARRATCEACDERVDIGLLRAPDCPHCGTSFVDLEPGRGFFRSSVLRTEKPALEGDVATDEAANDANDANEFTDLKTVRGIGPVYAARLGDAGVRTVGQLAAADPEALADQLDVPTGQVDDWIDRAASGTGGR